MDAPKCKICGERHWGACKPLKPEDLAGYRVVIGPQTIRTADQIIVVAPPKKRAPRGTFDRTAYQRELMRKRRAAIKAAQLD